MNNKIIIYILILTSTLTLSNSCNKEKNYNKNINQNINQNNQDYLDSINQDLINKTKKTKKKLNVKQENYALSIEGTIISKEIFENKYKKFLKETNSNIDKTNFILIFLQNYFILPKAQLYLANTNTKRFLKKQLAIQSFIKDKLTLYKKNIKVNKNELSAFRNYISKTKEYKQLKLNKNENKIIELYKTSKANQLYMQFEQKIKAQYSIISNDEWEKSIIEKYKKNSFNKTKALSNKEYKNYWLYKIYYNNKTKIKLLTIKDIENKIHISKQLQSPAIKSTIPKNKNQLLERFLTEELIYLYMQNKKLIQKYYSQIKPLMQKFTIEYYLTKKLKLSTKEKQRKYIEDFINSKQIKLNDLYFN